MATVVQETSSQFSDFQFQCSFVTDLSLDVAQDYGMGQSYRDLFAWQKAMDLVIGVYNCSRSFPRDETYGLSAQLRRTAILIPTNIADGQARFSPNEFFFFLGRARGALVEVETQLILAQRLGYLAGEDGQALLDNCAELGKILNGLISAIRPAA